MILSDCDVFCRVIDNFGDIGVAWRLARQLHHEHHQQVRLWVDDLSVFRVLMPCLTNAEVQVCEGVWVYHWQAHTVFEQVLPAKMVIETFGCHLPNAYRMALKRHPAFWVNLEYFSAEDWVVSCHRLPSLQHDGLNKYFFMPSIRTHAGGLLREAGLLPAREAFCGDVWQQARWREQYQIAEVLDGGIKISLFSYDNAAMPDVIDALIHAPCPVSLYMPMNKGVMSLNRHLGLALHEGARHQQGQLHIQVLPFLPQADYDRLLWWCDLNFVRGEDSLVRAIWAGKPFIWQSYPTEDLAHQDKLNAFIQHYYPTIKPAELPMISAMLAWNQMQVLDWQHWVQQLVVFYPQWQHLAQLASNQQLNRPSLTQALMAWASSKHRNLDLDGQ